MISDEDLMRAYIAGDTAAFSLLFQRLAPGVLGFFRRSFEAATADDLLQQTFLNAHRARATWASDKRVKPWLFTIAGNIRIDEWRRRKRAPEDGDEAIDVRESGSAPTDEQLDALRRDGRVQQALAELPEAQRVVLQLHYFEGLSFAEIGTAVGTTEGAAKLRAFRGYERLRMLLEEGAT